MKAKKETPADAGVFLSVVFCVVNQKRQKIEALQMNKKVAKTKEKNLISREIRFFLVETTGLEPVTSCV